MTALRYLMEPENGAAATGSSLSPAGRRCVSVREKKQLLRVQNTFKSPEEPQTSGGEGRSRTEADRGEVWRMLEAQCTIKSYPTSTLHLSSNCQHVFSTVQLVTITLEPGTHITRILEGVFTVLLFLRLVRVLLGIRFRKQVMRKLRVS